MANDLKKKKKCTEIYTVHFYVYILIHFRNVYFYIHLYKLYAVLQIYFGETKEGQRVRMYMEA